jgi:hypothetical protein
LVHNVGSAPHRRRRQPGGNPSIRRKHSDAAAFPEAVRTVRDNFGCDRMIFVGDRGMITNTRIAELRDMPGYDWSAH